VCRPVGTHRRHFAVGGFGGGRTREVRREERRDTVSSLRLDAVCSTGFRMARGKAAALIESGRVQLNWRECTKPDRTVSEGDTVSARGFGKFELTEVGALTKKGRIPITVQCYK